jgi:hypothetical protein
LFKTFWVSMTTKVWLTFIVAPAGCLASDPVADLAVASVCVRR